MLLPQIAGSTAFIDGRLQKEDRILEINGADMMFGSQDQALKVIQVSMFCSQDQGLKVIQVSMFCSQDQALKVIQVSIGRGSMLRLI